MSAIRVWIVLNIKRCNWSEAKCRKIRWPTLKRLPVSMVNAYFSTGTSLPCGYACGLERLQDLGVCYHWVCFGDCYHDENVILLLTKIYRKHLKLWRVMVE